MMISDNYLDQKKERMAKAILIFFSLTGFPVLFTQYHFGNTESALFQLMGIFLMTVITIDFFLRKKLFQSAIFVTGFAVCYFGFRSYQYQSFISPTILWASCLAPSVAWLTNRQLAIISYFLTYTSLSISAYLIFKSTGKIPTTNEIVFFLGIFLISGYFTYLVLETQKLYMGALENQIQIKKEEIHKNQLYTLGEFAGNIAHEMNNPFQVIKGNAALLAKKLGKIDGPEIESLQKYANNIDKTVDRTKKLIDGLLRLSRFPENYPELSSFKFSEIWNLVFPLLESKIRNSPAQITIENDQIEIFGQKDLLAQVVLNLFNNALFEIQNQKSPWIKIRISEDYLDVSDNGPGIPLEIKEKIFNPFFSTKSEQGTGLGLSLCLNIMNQMGGDLIILDKSEYTTFRIILPQKK